MIIANIGNTLFQLDSLADAEALLKIHSRARLIEKAYDADFRDYYYVSTGEKRIAVEITEGDELLSLDDHRAKLAERRAKEDQAKAAAALKAEAAGS